MISHTQVHQTLISLKLLYGQVDNTPLFKLLLDAQVECPVAGDTKIMKTVTMQTPGLHRILHHLFALMLEQTLKPTIVPKHLVKAPLRGQAVPTALPNMVAVVLVPSHQDLFTGMMKTAAMLTA